MVWKHCKVAAYNVRRAVNKAKRDQESGTTIPGWKSQKHVSKLWQLWQISLHLPLCQVLMHLASEENKFCAHLRPSVTSKQILYSWSRSQWMGGCTFHNNHPCEHQESSRTRRYQWAASNYECADQLAPMFTMMSNLSLAQSIIPLCYHHSCAQENKTSLPEWLPPCGTHLCSDEVLWMSCQGLHLLLNTQHTEPTTICLPSNWLMEENAITHNLHTTLSHLDMKRLEETPGIPQILRNLY